MPPTSLYSRYLGQGTLNQNGMHCRGTCVMCLRAQSLPLTYLYRCLSQCVVGGRLISTQLSPASVQFPVPNPAKRKTGRYAGFGDKKLQPWLAHASLFTHFTKSLSCVEFVSPSAGETCSSSRVAEERRRRTERRLVVAAVRPSCLGVLHSFLRGLSQRWRFRRCGWERGSLLQERLQVE